MPQVEVIRVSAVETVQVERLEKTVKLSLMVGSVQLVSKHLTAEAARQLGDALGFASNDMARPA